MTQSPAQYRKGRFDPREAYFSFAFSPGGRHG
jgi:hypothetical protein